MQGYNTDASFWNARGWIKYKWDILISKMFSYTCYYGNHNKSFMVKKKKCFSLLFSLYVTFIYLVVSIMDNHKETSVIIQCITIKLLRKEIVKPTEI